MALGSRLAMTTHNSDDCKQVASLTDGDIMRLCGPEQSFLYKITCACVWQSKECVGNVSTQRTNATLNYGNLALLEAWNDL